MDRSKLISIGVGLAAIAGLVGIELLGAKLSQGTRAAALSLLGLVLVEVRPVLGIAGGAK